ncbi:hypothetical protein F66182_10525, partial [Fusarium sp. NRRL 66182]
MSSNGTSNSKWPDFRLASTLWSLMGSQSNRPDKHNNNDRAQNNGQGNEQHHENEHRNEHSDELNQSRTMAHEMTDSEGQPIDGIDDFDNYAHDAQIDTEENGQDQDFGALEMFDSNAAQAPYSSQVNTASFEDKAPEALMSEEIPSSQTRKHKRDKKERRRKSLNNSASSQPPTEEESSRKPRKAKRKSALPVEIPDSLAENNNSNADQS